MIYLTPQNQFKNEEIRYVSQISKINRRNINQKREFVITNQHIYNVNKQQIKRTINHRCVNSIIMSKTSSQFVLKITNEYDYRFSSPERWKIYKEIINLSDEYNFKKPKLFLVQDESLQEYTLTSQKYNCKHPSYPIQFPTQLIPNLLICNLLQSDHHVLYVWSKDIYEVNPKNFIEILQLGRFTYLIENKDVQIQSTQKYMIKKIIPKYSINGSCTKIRQIFKKYKQKQKKQKILYILENPDQFLIISECYKYNLSEELNNFYEFNQIQIKKICQKVLCQFIQEEQEHIFIQNIVFNQKFDVIFTEFESYKSQNSIKLKYYMSPEAYGSSAKCPRKNKSSIFWNLGVFLYKLIYGIHLIPLDSQKNKQFFQNKIIYYDQIRKNSLSIELKSFLSQLLEFNSEIRFKNYIKEQRNECIIALVLKHPWFLKN